MKRQALDHRTRLLTAISARQRDAMRAALAPWEASARRIDRSAHWFGERRGWIGFVAGIGSGLLLAFKPRLIVPAARMLLMAWPFWRFACARLHSRRERQGLAAPFIPHARGPA